MSKTGPAQPVIGNRPRSHKDDFNIKDNKENSHKIKGNWPFNSSIVNGQNSRLVWFLLSSRAGFVTQSPGQKQKNRYKKRAMPA